MGAVRRLVDELRRKGVTVHEWPDWDGRGNEGIGQIDPRGGIVHHTGSNYGFAYPELVSSSQPWANGGCLCNFAGNRDGSLTVIASGLAYHAGKGAGPSLGPLYPYRSWMNGRTVGLEIVYPGDQPMTDAQYRAAQVWAKVVADLFGGGDIECVRAHAETNGDAPGGDGKWDPGFAPSRTIDMAEFRRGAVAATPVKDDDMLKDESLWLPYEPDGKGGRGRWDTAANALSSAHTRATLAHANTDAILARLTELESRIASGAGHSLEEIARAVVAEFKKVGN